MPSGKPTVGVDDLATLYPDIASEADGWDPQTVKSGSNKKMPWVCELGHKYEAKIYSRAKKTGGTGCPYCSGNKVLEGFNDLTTQYPEVAKQANGWDPKLFTGGSGQKKNWRCDLGHTWDAVISNRTNLEHGCPFCCGKQVLEGFNDLASLHPDIAKQADGWDPKSVTEKSGKKLQWKCDQGHTWKSRVAERTPPESQSCPYCSGKKAWTGFNDLKTLYPEIAAEADGWDPGSVRPGSIQKYNWKCKIGHSYEATINDRTPPNNDGCPYCSGRKVLKGFNDLKTLYPDLASEVLGWDPTTVTAGSNQKRKWKCHLNHAWDAVIASRTPPINSGCPYCSGSKVLQGFNDLKTLYPNLANEAYGWDPTTVTFGSRKEVKWRCEKGHVWKAKVNSRTPPRNTGCPECAKYGFDPGKDAYFYLMERAGEQQLGITNVLDQRLDVHKKNGWVLIEYVGPNPGRWVYEVEAEFKVWLRKEIEVVPGTSENWFTAKMEVTSLADLKQRSGIDTDLF